MEKGEEPEFGAEPTLWIVVEEAGVAARGSVQLQHGVSLHPGGHVRYKYFKIPF